MTRQLALLSNSPSSSIFNREDIQYRPEVSHICDRLREPDKDLLLIMILIIDMQSHQPSPMVGQFRNQMKLLI